MTKKLINDYLSEKVGALLSKEEAIMAKKITADFITYSDSCYHLHVANHP